MNKYWYFVVENHAGDKTDYFIKVEGYNLFPIRYVLDKLFEITNSYCYKIIFAMEVTKEDYDSKSYLYEIKRIN